MGPTLREIAEAAEADAPKDDALMEPAAAAPAAHPDVPYRPDVGLRNGVLISIVLWLVLIGAFVLF